ncbi:MAG TPA: SUMF1/EgtB/PvdO family nonheme iron enzyme [Myxococcota bacterium]|nr:SUMF1/EgtB/PvdO family nonheme iron enzyme [Myxococcota bacterium]HRY97221.1 SUMF1/EgtB/PvdO family nonheme iron enzyme [Myxococcota bacterium]HSA20656.1 SUMF1/EgtB/PvdO family nonheme iron enzyme [Myxococcota bacterium]
MRIRPMAAGLLYLGLALTTTFGTLAQDARPRKQTGDGSKQRLLEEELAQKLALEEEEKKKAGRPDGGPAGNAALEWVFSRPAGIELTRSEVTVAQYRACVEAERCSAPKTGWSCNWGQAGREQHPVNCVDWNQATAFCEWAGARLPTEQEWFAEASDGGERQYPWGDQEVSCERAIWSQGGRGCGLDSTWPVCSKPAGHSVSGLCDMSGNVWEWTSSSAGLARVMRGGSWSLGDPGFQRASLWLRYGPLYAVDDLGFRCGRSARPR